MTPPTKNGSEALKVGPGTATYCQVFWDIAAVTLIIRSMDFHFPLVSRRYALALLLALWLVPDVRSQETLLPAGSIWRWRPGTVEASNPIEAWRAREFDDAAWESVPAPFHFGTNAQGGDDAVLTGTILSNMRSNYTGIFLRHTFVITNVAEVEAVQWVTTYDDGFIAWINGAEVARANVRTGAIAFNTVASTSREGDPAATIIAAISPKTYLIEGSNILAVQAVNQNISTSSDFRFDTALQIIKRSPPDTLPPAIVQTQPAPGTSVGELGALTVTFGEPVLGVEAEDLQINSQPASSVSNNPEGTVFTFTFTQPRPGSISITWNDPPAIHDLSGNFFDPAAPGATWSYTLADVSPPKVIDLVPAPGAQVSRLAQVEVTFDEPIQGLDAADLRVNGQPASSLTGTEAGPYVFQFPPPPSGLVQLAWAASHGVADTSPATNAFPGGTWSVTLNPGAPPNDITINEFVAGNLGGLTDEDREVQDWIEIHNRGTNAVNLLGWSLTDDHAVPGKWTFPSRVLNSGQFLVVFASGKDRRALSGANRFHTNFKLNAFGDALALFNAESPRVAVTAFTPAFPEQRLDYSYGWDSSNRWSYFATPTPGAANGASAIAGLASAPHFSVPRGTFDTPFRLILTTLLDGAAIRFTTDGSEPTASTGLAYTDPLEIRRTTTLRAATFKAGFLPSRSLTQSYLFLDQVIDQPNSPPGFPENWGRNTSFPNGVVPVDYEMDLDPLRTDPNNPASPIDPQKMQRLKDGLRELPIVSLVLPTEDMFGATGLYPNGRESAVKASNEKACSIEMVLPDGGTAFAVMCGIDLHGNASRNPVKNPKHGFKLAFKGAYGESTLRYRLFPDSPAQEFDDLILRADFNSSWRHWSDSAGNGSGAFQRTRASRTRDAWIKETFRDMGNITSHSRYCHLFINGLYWGAYDFTEQPTDSFAVNYFGGVKSDYDVFDQGALNAGSATAYNAMVGLANLDKNSNYERMKQSLDIPEFIDYTLLHFFVGHQDWGGSKNWYAIRKRVPGPAGAFKYFPWDGECLLLSEDVNRVSNPDVPSGLHTKLDDNAEYRLEFADHVFKQILAPGGALTPSANIERWQKWTRVLDKPIVAESARWGDYRRDVHRYSEGAFVLYTRENQWLAENERMVNSYFRNRNATVLNQLRTAGLYPSVEAASFSQQGGRVPAGFRLSLSATAGTIFYTTDGSDPRVYGSGAVGPKAVAYSGDPLVLSRSTTVRARTLRDGTWSALNEAFFTVGQFGVPLRLTEIMYHPPGGDADEFLEVMNIGPSPLDLSGFSFQGLNFIFADGTILSAGATLLLSSSANPGAFHTRYPSASVLGAFDGNLDNGGERLAILDRQGQTIIAVHYDDANGWPTTPDGGGHSLEIIDPLGDPNAPDNWRASPSRDGTPGLPPTLISPSPVVLNEVMADNVSAVANNSEFPDWVELRNRGTEAVNLANWSLTDDGNPRKFVFPTGATLAAGGYLVVWCDSATNTPGLHAGFALGRTGDSLFLYDTNTNRADALSFGLQLPNYSIGRVGDLWRLTTPTPNAENSGAAVGAPAQLAINEWLAHPLSGGDDWIELFNRSAEMPVALRGLFLSTSNALCQIHSLSFLPPLGHLQMWADEQPGPNHLELKLPSDGGVITLTDETGLELERVTYGPQTLNVSEGKWPDGAKSIVAFPDSASPGASNYRASSSGPVINEVMARNRRALVSPWGTFADWIELHNPGDREANLSGLTLALSLSGGGRWLIPAGTSLPPGGHIVVWCDDSRAASQNSGETFNSGFALNGESGDLYLFNAAGQPIDSVSYGFQLSDQSIGRSGGAWRLLDSPTPGAANSAPAALGLPGQVRINEWQAHPETGDDWFELSNSDPQPVDLSGLFLSDTPSTPGATLSPIPALTFIGGHNWVKWIADGRASAGRNHVHFSLDQLGETLRLYDAAHALIDSVDFGLQADGISQGRWPDGGTNLVSFAITPSPGGGNHLPLPHLVINEVLTHTDPPLEDAIELFNPTDRDVAIGGWHLSDSETDLKRFRIPDGTVIAARGYRVFYQADFGPADGEQDIPPLFTLNSAHGDSVYLSETDTGGNLTGHRAEVTFGPAAKGLSFGRHPTSVGVDFVALSQRTFGSDRPADVAQFRTGRGLTNASPLISPVVISELMYHPASVGSNAAVDPGFEFIELHNHTPAPVSLFDSEHPTNVWRLAGAVSFAIPTNTVVAAGASLLVVPFDPANLSAAAAFRARYGVSVPLFGPYSGQLDRTGESVELLRPDAPQAPPHPDAGFVPYVLTDRVHYASTAPWPVSADGTGASLQRLRLADYGNDPANWKDAAPTPGRANVPITNSLPVIVTQPRNLSVVTGAAAVFNVVAEGSVLLRFQWRFNGGDIAGATAATLSLPQAQKNQSGPYTVLVTDALGSILSKPAELVILDPPSLIAPRINPAGQFTFSLTGSSDQPFAVESSTNLLDWTQLRILKPVASGTVFVDEQNANSTTRYYRARLIE